MLATGMMLFSASNANAQFGNKLKNLGKQILNGASGQVEQKVKSTAAKTVDKKIKDVENDLKNAGSGSAAKGAMQTDPKNIKGKVYYVNAENGSNRNDGTSKDQAFKDLQKAVNEAADGATICVAEGNYLGTLNQGYIEVKKYISIMGGYSSDFSDWDPVKYKTKIQPTGDQAGTSGNHGLMDVYVRGNRAGVVMINGIVFDKGQMNCYCVADYENPVASAPEGCETGRLVCVGESPQGVETFGVSIAQQELHGDVEGQVVITNCTFLNAYHYAIQMGLIGGKITVFNNLFLNDRMASCEIRGMNADPSQCSVEFYNNTVMFEWCRDKEMLDMGYGFRYMTGIGQTDVHDNIFGCSIFAALDRTYIDADKTKEANRVTNCYNNMFFANKSDLALPSGGGKFARVDAASFEDVEQFKEYKGNQEIPANEAFTNAIDQPYLKGYMGINISKSSSYNANSAANQINRLFGMNQQGSEVIRPTMYGNRYPFDKAFNLWGAVDGYGAQYPSAN
jgi:hypothetical protein